jgi:histidine ammonia-lyase
MLAAGEEVPKEIVKLMLLLKIQSLGYGHSGIQLQCKSSSFFNNDILPVIYTRFIRASGDLAPLAHLSLPLLEKEKSILRVPKCIQA